MMRFLFFAVAVVTIGALFPGVRRYVKRLLGIGAQPLVFDQRPFGYGPETVRDVMGALGPAGRERYRSRVIPYDRVFAIAYAVAGAAAGWAMFSYLGGAGYVNFSRLALAAGGVWVLGMVATVVEGALVSRLLRAYPVISAAQTRSASAATSTKFACLVLGGGGLVILAGFCVVAWLKG